MPPRFLPPPTHTLHLVHLCSFSPLIEATYVAFHTRNSATSLLLSPIQAANETTSEMPPESGAHTQLPCWAGTQAPFPYWVGGSNTSCRRHLILFYITVRFLSDKPVGRATVPSRSPRTPPAHSAHLGSSRCLAPASFPSVPAARGRTCCFCPGAASPHEIVCIPQDPA